MICKNCETQLPDGSTFCNVCGASLVPQGVPTAQYAQNGYDQYGQPVQPGYDQYGQPVQPGYDPYYGTAYTAPKKSNAKWFIIGGVAFVAVVVVALIIFFNSGARKLYGTWSTTENGEYATYTTSFEFKDNGKCVEKYVRVSKEDGSKSTNKETYDYEVDGDYLILTYSETNDGDTYKAVIKCKYEIDGDELTLKPISSKTYYNGKLKDTDDDFDSDDTLRLTKED